jgi:hypothetical protein
LRVGRSLLAGSLVMSAGVAMLGIQKILDIPSWKVVGQLYGSSAELGVRGCWHSSSSAGMSTADGLSRHDPAPVLQPEYADAAWGG